MLTLRPSVGTHGYKLSFLLVAELQRGGSYTLTGARLTEEARDWRAADDGESAGQRMHNHCFTRGPPRRSHNPLRVFSHGNCGCLNEIQFLF